MPVIWEIDFYSRPVLDEADKKVWEVLVCESPLTVDRPLESLFRYSEFCSGTEINSVRLRTALEKAVSQAPQPPDKIRFFRQAMNNMITKACNDMGIPAVLSRRTLVLNQWLQERSHTIYPAMPGYQAGLSPSINFAPTPPQRLPDALMGDKWQFVTLPAADFGDMTEWSIAFGEAFPLSLVDLAPETPVPGLLIYSSRALPLAAWMSGLELAVLKAEFESPARLLLETGISDRWSLALLTNGDRQTEARNFEATKEQAGGVHFLGIQDRPGGETFAGFWLLQAIDPA
jgi:hypothetical protein